jgi:thioredoxin-related protein
MGSDPGKKTEKIDWKTFDQGMALARKENKLLVIDFYTDWCHWCKVMDKDTYGNKEVINFVKEKAVMSKVNAETSEKFKFRGATYSGRELSMIFGVTGFPTTAFLNSKGELLTSISGFIPADQFTMILKYLAGNWYQKMEFEDFVKKEKQKDKG